MLKYMFVLVVCYTLGSVFLQLLQYFLAIYILMNCCSLSDTTSCTQNETAPSTSQTQQ